MEQNNLVLSNESGQSGSNNHEYLPRGGHYYDWHMRVPYMNIQRPPPHFRPFQPRGFPFPPLRPYMCVPPVFSAPPPPPSYIPDDARTSSLDSGDKVWLRNFLQSRSFHQPDRIPGDKAVSISNARVKLKCWLQLLEDLKGKHKVLQNGMKAISQEEWNAVFAEVEEKKSAILDCKRLYFENQSIENLRKIVLKRNRKRMRQKRQFAEEKKSTYLAQLKRQSLHLKADAWLTDMQLAVERTRKDEELKREADAVLAEVTRRQSEGRRQIALLEALLKLHHARIQTMEARGSKLSFEEKQRAEHSTSIFGRLLAMWSKKMDEYAKEEHGLRVMLEESAAKQSDKEIEKVRRILGKWETCLFGLESSRKPDEPSDIDTLVSIRYAWDQYLAPDSVLPMASTIPVGWVLPTTPSSPEWQKLLSR